MFIYYLSIYVLLFVYVNKVLIYVLVKVFMYFTVVLHLDLMLLMSFVLIGRFFD